MYWVKTFFLTDPVLSFYTKFSKNLPSSISWYDIVLRQIFDKVWENNDKLFFFVTQHELIYDNGSTDWLMVYSCHDS